MVQIKKGNFQEKGKNRIFSFISVVPLTLAMIMLVFYTDTRISLPTDNGSGITILLVLFGLCLIFLATALFYYFIPVELEFKYESGRLEIDVSRFNRPIEHFQVTSWEIKILSISNRYGGRVALAMKVNTAAGAFTITEDIEDSTNPGYPIILCNNSIEKYSSNTPGTITAVVKMLEGKKTSAITAEEASEKYY